MFKKSTIYLLLFAGMIFPYSGCKKNSSGDPLSQLPPLTTKGLNTFGCLVNGNVFTLKGLLGDIGPYYACTYQYVYADTAKPYNFAVWGEHKADGCHFASVAIGLDSVNIKTGDVYDLIAWRDSSGKFIAGKNHGGYSDEISCLDLKFYYTTDLVKGQITFVLLDPVNQIASGTFWFDAIFTPGDTVHITDGRFDMHYTD